MSNYFKPIAALTLAAALTTKLYFTYKKKQEEDKNKPVFYIIQHSPGVPPGFVSEFLDKKKAKWRVIRLDQGDELPTLTEEDASRAVVISLGGVMGAYDEKEYSFIGAEKAWYVVC